MKPHPTPHKLRKTIKWGGAVVTVLLVVVWIGSGWIEAAWKPRGSTYCFLVGSGLVGTCEFTPHGNPALTYRQQTFSEFRATPFVLDWFSTGKPGTIATPVWPFALAMLGLTRVAWHLDTLARRRARLNLCPKCNYDRTGLVGGAIDAKCPECGHATAA